MHSTLLYWKYCLKFSWDPCLVPVLASSFVHILQKWKTCVLEPWWCSLIFFLLLTSVAALWMVFLMPGTSSTLKEFKWFFSYALQCFEWCYLAAWPKDGVRSKELPLNSPRCFTQGSTKPQLFCSDRFIEIKSTSSASSDCIFSKGIVCSWQE